MTKRSLGMLIALGLLAGGVARAAELEGRHHIELRAPLLGPSSMTSCEHVVDLAVCYSFLPRVDPVGKFAVSGTATVEGYVEGVPVSGSFPARFSGSIRGVAGDGVEPVSKLKLAVVAREVSLLVSGVARAADLSLKVSGELDHAEPDFRLEGRRSLAIDGLGRSAGSVRLSFQNTAPLTIWDLWLTLDPAAGGKLAGSARLSVQNGLFAPLGVRGSHSPRVGSAKLSLTPGADLKGASIKLARVDLSGVTPKFELRFKLHGIRGVVSSAGENGSWSIVPVVDTFESEGTRSEPVEIGAGLVHEGAVGPVQWSWYVIRGLAPNAPHTIELERDSAITDVLVRGTDGGSRLCGHLREGPDAVVTCTARSDSAGELLFWVADRPENDAGGQFRLSFRAGGILNEGEWNAPLDINPPYRGASAEASYYRIRDLTPGTTYTVNVGDASGGDITYHTSRDSSESQYEVCGFKKADEPCSFIAPASGEIWVTVAGSYLGVEYTVRLETGGTPNEGSPVSPIDLTGVTSHAGTMMDQLGSYYRVTGLAPGAAHTVTLVDIDAPVSLQLYGSGWHSTSPVWSCLAANDLDEETVECVAQADSSGVVVARVVPLRSLNGSARYRVQHAAGGLPNEGYPLPVDVTGQLPRSSTVHDNGGSQYLVRGLGNRPVTVSVVLESGAGCLAVNVVTADRSTGLCSSYACGAGSCTATPVDGELRIQVATERGAPAQTFTLDVD